MLVHPGRVGQGLGDQGAIANRELESRDEVIDPIHDPGGGWRPGDRGAGAAGIRPQVVRSSM
jgi:hypothetical protein